MKRYNSKQKDLGITIINKAENCKLSVGKQFMVEEIVYPVEGQSLGHVIVPIVDRNGSLDSDDYRAYPLSAQLGNETIHGCERLDELIRKELGLNQHSPVCAFLSYFHPENSEINFQEIGSEGSCKTELSITHNGIYIGQGKTRNSPFDYHNQKLEVAGYPAMISVVELDGVPNEVLALNLFICTRLLNESNGGVDFPSGYKTDTFHLTSLNAMADHLRAMLDKEWINETVSMDKPFNEILESCDLFMLYCAEHMWFIINVALNIPQNKQGYIDFFGETAGAKLFEKVKEEWAKINLDNPELPLVPFFEPLWKKENVHQPYKHKDVGRGLYTNPLTTADLIKDIVRMYAPWNKVGPSYSIAVILGFIDPIKERLGVDTETILIKLGQVIRNIAECYLLTTDKTAEQFKSELKDDIALITNLAKEKIEMILDNTLLNLANGEEKMTVEAAYKHFESNEEAILEVLRKQEPTTSFDELVKQVLSGVNVTKLVQYYNPPSTLHKIAREMMSTSQYVKIRTVGTVMDLRDVQSSEQEIPPAVEVQDQKSENNNQSKS